MNITWLLLCAHGQADAEDKEHKRNGIAVKESGELGVAACAHTYLTSYLFLCAHHMNQLEVEYQKVEAMPRPEAAPKRTALGKLMKDFDKVKVNIQAILNESSLVKVVNERGEVESFARTGSAVNGSVSTPNGSSNNSSNKYAPQEEQQGLPAPPPMNKQQQAQHIQQLKLQPILSGKEVDDAILEERERDIKKMNHDLILVNEMFQ